VKYAVLLFSLSVLFWSCEKKTEKVQPVLEQITESVYASGLVKSKNQYQVFAAVPGIIQRILVQEGDLVKKGDPLFVIQHETSKLSAENAQLAVDFTRSSLQGEKLAELQNAIELARTNMLNDSIWLKRRQGLWAQGIGSKVELEQSELAYSASMSPPVGINGSASRASHRMASRPSPSMVRPTASASIRPVCNRPSQRRSGSFRMMAAS